jgi:uncharacterized protein
LEDKRIEVLDVLRGVAILGILLANITAFAEPSFSAQLAPVLPQRSAAEALFDASTMAFVNGKFRSILAILFGVGLWLQFERKSGEGTWPLAYVKRLAILFAIGLLHGYLIWPGDILATYAAVALACMIFIKTEERTLRWLIGLLALNCVLTVAVLLPILFHWFASKGAVEWDFGAVWPVFSTAGETQIFQAGTWWQQLGFRAIYNSLNLLNILMFGPFLMPLFLFGMLLGKHQVLQDPRQHPRLTRWCLISGFGIGLPLSLVAFIPMSSRSAETLQIAFEFVLGPLLGLGILFATALGVASGRGRLITRPLARLGRVALSAYLLQSLLATAIFYSWGFGLFGKLGPAGWLGVVAAIWAIDLLFAQIWLRVFRLGPAEWLWRSLSEGKRLPIIRRSA